MIKRLIAALLAAVLLAGCAAPTPDTSSIETSSNSASTVPTESTVPENMETVPPVETVPTTSVTEQTEAAEPEPVIPVVQMNSINMLNYLAFTAEEIYVAKDNRLLLEDIYTSLLNEINPGTIDEITQDHLRNLRDIIKSFLNIDTKRARLQYIYNQNKAAAMRNAVPDPMAILSVANSLDWKRLVASVAFTVVDSYNNFKAASESANQDFLMSGWVLDDEETATIQRNRERAFDYMVDIVQEYGSDELSAQEFGKLTLNEKAVEDFAEICATDEVYRKIQLLQKAENTYKLFGNYWLELADCYYEIEEYQKCLDCVSQYNELATGVFRKDFNLVPILPKAIVAAQEVYEGGGYISAAQGFVDAIIDNTSNDDWAMRYFAAQVYLDLYSRKANKEYLVKAYEEAKNNVAQLVDEQCKLNDAYLADVQELTVEEPDYSFATDEEKKELKAEYNAEKKRVSAYNKELKETRKTELPSLYEPLILNCDLLFALAEQLDIDVSEQKIIGEILKTESNGVFLSKPINDHYSFVAHMIDESIEITTNELVIPAVLLTQGARIIVTVKDEAGTNTFDDWAVAEVERKGAGVDSFYAHCCSEAMKSFTWSLGATATVSVENGENYDPISFVYKVTEYQNNWIISDKVVFEAV